LKGRRVWYNERSINDNLLALEKPLDSQLKQKLDDLTADYRRGDAAR
jgi:aryl-alcohol dehydrogenase (NADP+)